MVGPLFSLYLNYLPYLRMYVKVTSVESRAVGLTLHRYGTYAPHVTINPPMCEKDDGDGS